MTHRHHDSASRKREPYIDAVIASPPQGFGVTQARALLDAARFMRY